MSTDMCSLWERVRDKASGYPPQAFAFVHEGLQHTVEMIRAAREEQAKARGGSGSISQRSDTDDEDRHITGQEFCFGLRDFAIRQFGMMARTVLASWRIRSTDDIGRIVFILVGCRVLRKSETDCPEDFCGVFDFDDAFAADFNLTR